MTPLVLSILNGSSSILHTIRTIVKALMSLNFVKIRSPILELAPLGHLKNCDRSSVYIFYLIFFILSSNKDKHKSLDEFEILHDPTTDL